MKNLWKWILGILIGLLVLGAILAAPLVLRGAFGGNFAPAVYQPGWRVPMHPFDGRDFDRQGWRMPMRPFDGRIFDRFGPMMGERGFSGFTPFFGGLMLLGGLLRLVVPLGILALVAWLAYQQGKKAGMASAPARAASAPEPDGAPEA